MGQPQNNQGKQQSQQNQQQSSQPRDTRKELGEQNQQTSQQDKDKPQGGQDSPTDPANRLEKGRKQDDPNAEPPKRKDDTPPWFAALPPEIRDAIDAGRGEEIPAKNQELVRRYNLWLQKQRRTGRR